MPRIISKIGQTLKRGRLKIFLAALGFLERATDNVVTLRMRPLYSRDITHVADPLVSAPRCAIVMQGPIMKKYNFTLETIRIYRKVYPGLTVIVSTWEDEDPEWLELMREAGAHVVLNAKPEYFGIWNINLQIISTRAGIAYAKELGIPYTIKSRVDQRIYERNILETLYNLVSYFPPAQSSGLHKRIVVCHLAYKYYDAYFPDMFMFGDTDDLLEYWSAPLLRKGVAYKEFFSELYLTHSFRKRKGWPISDSIRAVWDTYRDCIIVMDWDDLDILWPKYEYFWEQPYIRRERYQQVTASRKFIDLSFNEWFNIFSNADNKIVSSVHEEKFAHFLKTVNFSDYERNYHEHHTSHESHTL